MAGCYLFPKLILRKKNKDEDKRKFILDKKESKKIIQ